MGFELSHQNRIQSKKIRINDEDVKPEEFVSFTMNTSLFEDKQYCTLILKEVKGSFTEVTQESLIEFYIKDRFGNEYLEEEFVILSISKTIETAATAANIYTIEFIDKIHFDMMNTYESLSFKDALGSDILTKMFKPHDNGTTKWNITPTKYVYPQWLAPQNVNHAKIARKVALENELFFYRGLEHYSFKTYEEMIKDVLPEEVIIKYIEGEAYHKVLESSNTIYDSFETMRDIPSCNLYTMDALDKKVLKVKHSLEDFVKEVKVNSTNNFHQLTIPGKESTRSGMSTLKTNRLRLKYQKEIIKNTSLKIIIDGDMRIEPGKVIDVLLTHKGEAFEDLTVSGTYLVVSVSSNFVGDNFYQEIVISRV